MKISCIMTTFNDGPILRQSIASVLNQTHEDLELILVDDGSGPETKAILEEMAGDERLQVIPQANDGLSSARNRGLHHARGDVICFLDGDDVRAPWAFATAATRMEETGAELLLVQGVHSGERSALKPFFDTAHHSAYRADLAAGAPRDLATSKAWATTMEPQSANKFIARDLIERGRLRFPNDHFFEDILFHTLCIAHARSIAFLDGASFTYFQRALRPQLTGASSQTRFDVLGTARVTLELFQRLPDFANPRQRGALVIGVMRLVSWCESCIASYHRFAFRTALRDCLRSIDPLYFVLPENTPDPRGERARIEAYMKEAMA